MKRKYTILAAVLAIVLVLPGSAHSGRTDSKGGHYNRSTGEYHYHHGYPEHQHNKDGSCPYVLEAKEKAKKEEAARIERERKKRRRKEISKNVALCSVGAAVTGGTVGVIVNKVKKRKK